MVLDVRPRTRPPMQLTATSDCGVDIPIQSVGGGHSDARRRRSRHGYVADAISEYLQTDGPDWDLNDPLFTSPPTIRVFDTDLKAAGISRTDARGHVLDIHALRHTFGTHLSAAGVHPRIAMAAMRHSRIDLTMNLYTDPALLDVAGAVAALPAFGASQSRAVATPSA